MTQSIDSLTTEKEQQQRRERLEGFAELIQAAMQDWNLPGLAIAIVSNNEVLLARGFGKRNVEQGLEMTSRTLLPIGSCTKAFTATALGILADEGKLDWDAPVRNYLPMFKLHDPWASERITTRDLMAHRSGLPRHDFVWYNSTRTRQELMESLQYLEPTKDFRSTWQYQNLMYMVASEVAHAISGLSWEDFVRQRIFEPLNMKASNYSVLDTQHTTDFSLPYKKKQDEVVLTSFYERFQGIAAAGAIISNVEEMSQWLLLQLNKGKHGDKQIVTENQLAQIHTPQMVIPGPREFKELSHSCYAMGWMVASYRGHLLLQHGGGIDGFSSLTTFLPDDNIGIVTLTNMAENALGSVATFEACDRLLRLESISWNKRIKAEFDKVMQAMEKAMKSDANDIGRVPDTRPSHALSAYIGEFVHPGYGKLTVGMEDDQLNFTFNDMTFPLKHYHYDIFEATVERFFATTKVSFTTNMKGDIDCISLMLEPTAKEITFKRVPEVKDRAFLERFTGEYEFMSIVAIVEQRDDRLFLTVPGQPRYELEPYKDTQFNIKGLSGYSVEFKQDADGATTEAIFSQPQGTISMKRKKA